MTKTLVADNIQTPRPTGAILLSQRKQVSFKQAAWTDETTYVAPFIGEADQTKMYFALQAKYTERSTRTSVCIKAIDLIAKTITFNISYAIWD